MNACPDTDWNGCWRAPAYIWSYCVSLRVPTTGYKRVLSAGRCRLALTPLLHPRLTMELIPCWNPTGSRPVQKLSSFSGTPTSSAVFTTDLYFAPWIQIKIVTSYIFSIHFNIIFQSKPMFSKRCLSLDFPIKTPHPFYVLPSFHLMPLTLFTAVIFGDGYKSWRRLGFSGTCVEKYWNTSAVKSKLFLLQMETNNPKI
jgi:hypothetical protein